MKSPNYIPTRFGGVHTIIREDHFHDPNHCRIVCSVRRTSYLHQHGSTSAAPDHSAHQNAGVGDIGVRAWVRACELVMLRSGVIGCLADRFTPTAYRPIPTAPRLMPTVNRLIPTVRTLPTAHRLLPKLVHDVS